MNEPVKILGVVGSLRRDSYNKALMRTAVALKPKNAVIEVFDLEEIPPFNQDLEETPPEIVKKFKAAIRAASPSGSNAPWRGGTRRSTSCVC
ncbi:MAG: NAD(P)H-dependent oxidoreductase, partial [Candidatus Bathyarchaeota archaeon]|nr:NAD(P)H-dependent oxidoreductase [Candidatus Bathyarchaeota archaeon]